MRPSSGRTGTSAGSARSRSGAVSRLGYREARGQRALITPQKGIIQVYTSPWPPWWDPIWDRRWYRDRLGRSRHADLSLQNGRRRGSFGTNPKQRQKLTVTGHHDNKKYTGTSYGTSGRYPGNRQWRHIQKVG